MDQLSNVKFQSNENRVYRYINILSEWNKTLSNSTVILVAHTGLHTFVPVSSPEFELSQPAATTQSHASGLSGC